MTEPMPLTTDASAVTKHSLAFILDRQNHSNVRLHHWYHSEQLQSHRRPVQQQRCGVVPSTSVVRQGSSLAPPVASLSSHVPSPQAQHHDDKQAASKPRSRKHGQSNDEKRRARQCTVDGCTNYTIDRGLCFRHGGGKTCSVDGCERSAKARGLCWRHGGSIRCSALGCSRGAKSRGLCWSHGGGKRCAHAKCNALVPRRQGSLCELHQKEREPFEVEVHELS